MSGSEWIYRELIVTPFYKLAILKNKYRRMYIGDYLFVFIWIDKNGHFHEEKWWKL